MNSAMNSLNGMNTMNTKHANLAANAPAGTRGPIVVIKIGGALLDDAAAAHSMLDVIIEASRARHGAAGPGVVIVHGGGKAVDRQLDRLGMVTERREGIRITPPAQMDQIAGVLAGVINTSLVGWFTARGVPAVGLGLTDGLCCRVDVAADYAFDPGRVGEVVGGDGRLLTHLIDGGFLPVMSSIGLDHEGGLLNVNADDAAVAVARIVGATTLLLLTDVPGVRGPDGAIVESIDRKQAERWIESGTISGGMIVKVRGALDAAEHAGAAVGRVLIASWNEPAALRAVLEGRHAGTRVVGASTATAAAGCVASSTCSPSSHSSPSGALQGP